MKLITLFYLLTSIVKILAGKQPYTTPSPYGSYRMKQLKCSCTDVAYKYLYSNFTCYAKAHSRDLTTFSAYTMVKRDITKMWISGYVEYKYGTIYRTVLDFTQNKKELCDLIKYLKDLKGPFLRIFFQYAMMLAPNMIHPCPYKAGEEVFGYNLSIDPKYIPSIFNQGDYRGALQTYLEHPDQLACNNTVVISIISPIKESFGRK